MATQSAYLQLYLYNNTTDRDQFFTNFRENLAGPSVSSNMQKIDAFASKTNERLVTLENRAPIITINAESGEGDNDFKATNSNFKQYDKDMLLLIYLPVDNAGLATISINDGDKKSLMKIGPEGTAVNLDAGDLKANVGYLFQYDGTQLLAVGQAYRDVIASSEQPNGQFTGGIWLKQNAGGSSTIMVKQSDGTYQEAPASTKATVVTFDDNSTLQAFKESIETRVTTAESGIKTNTENIASNLNKINILLQFVNKDSHNSLYRGKQLGTSAPTAAQYAAIAAGTFDDLYIGDYWTIGGINYRIADFNYYLHTGDTETTANHIVIVPDTSLYTAKMNDTNITTGGYVGSKMYTEYINNARTTIKNAFSGHVLKHRDIFSNAVTNGLISGYLWTDSEVDLMSEQMVYGNGVFQPVSNGTTVPTKYRLGKSQLSLFRFRPDLMMIGVPRTTYWLRDPVSASSFASVHRHGSADFRSASASHGVRPAFAIS